MQQEINTKFKDAPPSETVSKIKKILDSVGIRVRELWNESGIANCWSMNVMIDNAFPLFANGKGITRELAQASAYAELVERLQCGLALYKYQSINRDSTLDLQSYAPDGKYVTMQELIADGDWMDYIIQSFGNGLTRTKIAKLCRTYACTDQDAIWVVPYYSIFEKKYVYLPSHFIEQIYCSNGCCAGNTREEAWVHGLSEILERHNTIAVLTSGNAVPKIPESVIRHFSVPAKILDAVKENPHLDLEILDFSLGLDYPVLATRLINKTSHGYHINVGCDPVFEIALDRTLTEIFQGRDLTKVGADHDSMVYEELPKPSMEHNLFNQIELGNGIFYADFFVDDPENELSFTGFTDHSDKTNKELLEHVLSVFKKMNRPVYIRNYSFLGFPSYYIVVPGFSEFRGLTMLAPVNEYAIGYSVLPAFRNPEAANTFDLQLMLTYYNGMIARQSLINNFGPFSGLPMEPSLHPQLTHVTLGYAAYKLNKFADAIDHLRPLAISRYYPHEIRDYFACVIHYLRLKLRQIDDQKINLLLRKFYDSASVDKMLASIRDYDNPMHPYLLRCNTQSCSECYIREQCFYANCSRVFKALGERYSTFTNGQDEKEFI